jgi:hypothetical protein
LEKKTKREGKERKVKEESNQASGLAHKVVKTISASLYVSFKMLFHHLWWD